MTVKESKEQPEVEEESAAERRTTHDKILKLLEKLETRLHGEELKPSLGDFIRLVQLEKELADEEAPREIKVTWVERPQASESGK